MQFRSASAVAVGFAALGIGCDAWAQRVLPEPALAEIALDALDEDAAVEKLHQALSTLIPSAVEISQAYVDRRTAIADANVISQAVADILRYDLDADGVVTRDEASSAIAHELWARRTRRLDNRENRDAINRERDERLAHIFADHSDGELPLAAIQAKAAAEVTGLDIVRYPQPLLQALLAVDPDGDEVVSRPEAEQIIRTVYRSLDLNEDGRIDSYETRIYREIQAQVAGRDPDGKRIMLDEPRCSLGSIDADTRVIALNVGAGDTMSPVAITGFDRAVTVVKIIVHPSSIDTVLVLGAASDVIFVFEGAVEKLRRVVLTRATDADAGAMGSAVKGISNARIVRSPPGDCYVGQGKIDHRLARSLLKRMLFKAGASRFEATTFQIVHAISLPSGDEVANAEAWSPPGAAPPEIVAELIRYAPGGVAVLEPSQIKANSAFQPRLYEVMPREAGLMQSAIDGVLEPVQIPRFWRNGYRLLKPLAQIPAGLAGMHAVGFIQPEGFPVPRGSIEDSCLFEEKTDRLLLGTPENCAPSGGAHPR